MATIKNTPRYLNTDSDERVLQKTEMSDALNIRVTTEDNGDAGVVKNIDGNTILGAIGNTTAGSVNKIVGSYEHEGTNRLFVFVHNSLGIHTIYELNQGDSSFTKIIESSNVSLSGEPLSINGMVIDEELHLYFTDGEEEPQKVNVDTSLAAGTYPSSFVEASVMKKAPNAPQVSISTDSSKKSNELYGKAFQFALQYVYRDGEVSAIGEYSDEVAGSNTLDGLSDSTSYKLQDNKIELQIGTGTLGVGLGTTIPNVRAFYKSPEDNTMYYIGEYTATEISNGIDFYNDKSYPAVPDTEYNKTVDNVPKLAKAQTIEANRLFYANYKEGFDKGDVSASLTVEYDEEGINEELDVTITAMGSGEDHLEMFINTELVENVIDGNSIPTTIDFVFGQFFITETTQRGITFYKSDGATVKKTFASTDNTGNKFNITNERYTESLSVAATNLSDYNTNLATALNGETFTLNLKSGNAKYTNSGSGFEHDTWSASFSQGSVTFEITASASAAGNGVDLEINPLSFVASGTTAWLSDSVFATAVRSYVTSLSGNFGTTSTQREMTVYRGDNFSTVSSGVSNRRTFKSGESHSFGVVFEDQLGRTTGVYELGSVDVLRQSERAKKGRASVKSTLTAAGLDSALTNFFYVYSGGNNISDYVQYSVPSAFVLDTTKVDEGDNEAVYVSLRALQGAKNSYCEVNDIKYQYTEGDKLRILSYKNSDGIIEYPSGFEFDVVGLETIESDSFVLDGVTYDKKIHDGEFVIINGNPSAFGFNFEDLSNWANDVVVEIYSPSKEAEVKVYKAISGKYSVSTDISLEQTITEGNAWYKQRVLKFTSDDAATPTAFRNEIRNVESNQYFDRDDVTKSDLGGKPYAVIANEKEHSRISSITYSEPQFADSAQNYLSSFNASLANFKDFELNYGGIFGIVGMSDSIMMLQSDKVSRIPVSRQILATGTGSEFVTQSTDILGLQQHYAGNFGINEDRTAFLSNDGTVYLVDVTRSKIVAITPQGVKVLNDLGVDSWINDRTSSMLEDANGYFVSVGIDKDNDEVYFSLQNLPLTSYSESMVYSKQLDKFTSKNSVAAPYFGTLGLRFFSFRDNDCWEQNTNSTKANFYGVQEESNFKISFNESPSLNKVFNALSIEGTADADVEMTTSNNQNLTMPKEAFKLREGEYYAKVGRSDSDFNKIVVGKIASINGDNVTFLNRVNRIPFKLGGDAFVYTGGSYSAVAGTSVSGVVDAYTLSFVNASNLSPDRVIAISGEGVVDGEPMRGFYSTAKFTFDDVEDVEVFAVNASIAQSNLHNDNTSQ